MIEMKLLALELEGFQSFRDRQRIEFAPITLLYGPNSAGKSAVFDAFAFLRAVLGAESDAAPEEMFKRWAWVAGGVGNADHPNKSMSFAVEFEMEMFDPREVIDPEFPFGGDDWYDLVRATRRRVVRIELRHAGNDAAVQNVSVVVDEARVFDFTRKDSSDATVIFCADESLGFDKERFAESVRDAESAYTDSSESSVRVDVVHNSARVDDLIPMSYDDCSDYLTPIARAIVRYFCVPFRIAFDRSPPLIREDRRVPSPEQASRLVTPAKTAVITAEKILAQASQGRDPIFDDLARMAHASLIVKSERPDFVEDIESGICFDGERVQSSSRQCDLLNTYLSEHLFNEKLYQVRCDSFVIAEYAEPESHWWQPAVVTIHVLDGESRRFELHDVGSGVSFVLPVLTALVGEGIVQVQQPELHLHPALQGSLADAFIDRLHQSGRFQALVETHSEHFLLRFLRRIRDKARKKSAPGLGLTADDVAVYYFDPPRPAIGITGRPQPTDGTRIERQRLTPLGDFYRDWPRGFFSDRDQDLEGLADG